MELNGIFFRVFVPFSFSCDDMNKHRLFKIHGVAKYRDHLVDVVPVYRPKIPEPQFLKKYAGNKQILKPFLKFSYSFVCYRTQFWNAFYYLFPFFPYFIVKGVCDDLVQVSTHRSDGF